MQGRSGALRNICIRCGIRDADAPAQNLKPVGDRCKAHFPGDAVTQSHNLRTGKRDDFPGLYIHEMIMASLRADEIVITLGAGAKKNLID